MGLGGLGCRVFGLGFRVCVLRIWDVNWAFRVALSEVQEIQDLGFGVSGLGSAATLKILKASYESRLTLNPKPKIQNHEPQAST